MAQADWFLKLTGIPGESKSDGHENEIELLSWSWSESNTGSSATGGGSGTGKVIAGDFHFTQKMSKASPLLFLACANGEHIKEGIVTCRKAGKGQQEFMKWTFSDLLVSSYSTGGAGSGDPIPIEQVSLNFSKLEQEYKEQEATGPTSGSTKKWYDYKKQKFG
jgi:type VI secretion system secreted protein Hcp